MVYHLWRRRSWLNFKTRILMFSRSYPILFYTFLNPLIGFLMLWLHLLPSLFPFFWLLIAINEGWTISRHGRWSFLHSSLFSWFLCWYEVILNVNLSFSYEALLLLCFSFYFFFICGLGYCFVLWFWVIIWVKWDDVELSLSVSKEALSPVLLFNLFAGSILELVRLHFIRFSGYFFHI